MPIPNIIPKGTTLEQWEQYEREQYAFESRMRAIEPADKNSVEYNLWLASYCMDAPNKPGYYRANND